MNETRQQQLLQGHTALAKKVYEFVPIQEAWPASAINTALRTNGQTAAHHVAVRACLGDLKDQGLIKEVKPGIFQRLEVTVKIKPKNPPGSQTYLDLADPNKFIPQNPPKGTPVTKPSNPVLKLSDVAALSKLPPSAIDTLATLAEELVVLSDDFGARMKALSVRIEEVALVVEAERMKNSEASEKLKTLQSIFGSL